MTDEQGNEEAAARERLGEAAEEARETIEKAAGKARGMLSEAAVLASAESAEKAIALASQLVAIVSDIQERLKKLAQYGRHNRNIIIGLVVSLAIDVAVSVTTIIITLSLSSQQVAINRQQAAITSQQVALHNNQLTSCNNSNTMKRMVIAVWTANINTFHKNDPAGAAFLRKVEKTYAPVDCAKLYP